MNLRKVIRWTSKEFQKNTSMFISEFPLKSFDHKYPTNSTFNDKTVDSYIYQETKKFHYPTKDSKWGEIYSKQEHIETLFIDPYPTDILRVELERQLCMGIICFLSRVRVSSLVIFTLHFSFLLHVTSLFLPLLYPYPILNIDSTKLFQPSYFHHEDIFHDLHSLHNIHIFKFPC